MSTPKNPDPFEKPAAGEPGDRLWEVLGTGRVPKVSSRFTQDVLRMVRQEPQVAPTWHGRLAEQFARIVRGFETVLGEGAQRAVWVGAAAAVVVGATVAVISVQGGKPGGSVAGIPESAAHDEVIAEVANSVAKLSNSPGGELLGHLDELLAMEDNSLWLGDSPSNF